MLSILLGGVTECIVSYSYGHNGELSDIARTSGRRKEVVVVVETASVIECVSFCSCNLIRVYC